MEIHIQLAGVEENRGNVDTALQLLEQGERSVDREQRSRSQNKNDIL